MRLVGAAGELAAKRRTLAFVLCRALISWIKIGYVLYSNMKGKRTSYIYVEVFENSVRPQYN